MNIAARVAERQQVITFPVGIDKRINRVFTQPIDQAVTIGHELDAKSGQPIVVSLTDGNACGNPVRRPSRSVGRLTKLRGASDLPRNDAKLTQASGRRAGGKDAETGRQDLIGFNPGAPFCEMRTSVSTLSILGKCLQDPRGSAVIELRRTSVVLRHDCPARRRASDNRTEKHVSARSGSSVLTPFARHSARARAQPPSWPQPGLPHDRGAQAREIARLAR